LISSKAFFVADIEGVKDADDTERRGFEDVDGGAGVDDVDGASGAVPRPIKFAFWTGLLEQYWTGLDKQ